MMALSSWVPSNDAYPVTADLHLGGSARAEFPPQLRAGAPPA